MKKIYFYEYNYVPCAFPVKAVVSEEDYKKFENNEIKLKDLIKKSEYLDYGVEKPLYDNMYLDEKYPYELAEKEDFEEVF